MTDKKEVYEFIEVYNSTLEYFGGDELATNVWMKKYCMKNKEGQYLELNPDMMHWRLAHEIHRIEMKYKNPLNVDEIYELLKNFKYIIPGGSNMFGVGNSHSLSSLANCFVIGNTADSYSGIFMADQEQAQLMKRRGGVGHDLSHIRPTGSKVTNAAESSTGIVPFMERFSNTTREVAQDGRRGALMLTLDVRHPDVYSFVTAKDDLTKVTGANISVKLNDEFMNAVNSNDDSFVLRYPIHIDSKVDELVSFDSLTKFNDGVRIKIHAKKLWETIIHQAWKTAEPGLLFWDNSLRESPADCYSEFKSVSTNPCSEIILSPYDSCRLLSINAYGYVVNPFSSKAYFDFELYKKHVMYAQRIMDDIVDLENEKIDAILAKIDSDPEEEYIKMAEKNLWAKIKKALLDGRRTGTSTIGIGDVIAALNIKYGSEESIQFIDKLYSYHGVYTFMSSVLMAEERGSFNIFNFENERNNPYLRRIITKLKELEGDLSPILNKYRKFGRRNVAMNTIPPAGTLAIMAQQSSGIEPVFNVFYKRRRKVDTNSPKVSYIDTVGDSWEEYFVLHHKFVDWYIEVYQPEFNRLETIEYLSELPEVAILELVKQSPYNEAMANDIDPLTKVKLSGTAQKYIDHSISQTINLPENISEKIVSDIYMSAWHNGLKGVTVYRENSRSGVLINTTSENKTQTKFDYHDAPKRPKSLPADYYVTKSKGKTYAVIVGLYENKPYEIFAYENPECKVNTTGVIIKKGKGKYTFQSDECTIENLELSTDLIEEKSSTVYISMLLRHGARPNFVTKTMTKVDDNIVSFSSAIRRIINKHYVNGSIITSEDCPDCGAKLHNEGGCIICKECGYSKC